MSRPTVISKIPKNRPRIRRWLAWTLAIIFTPILGIALWFGIDEWQFQNRLAKIRAAGDPVNADDLKELLKPPTIGDTTPLWNQALESYEAAWEAQSPEQKKIALALPCLSCGDPIPVPGRRWQQLEDAQAFLKSQSQTLELCRRASEQNGRAAFAYTLQPGAFDLNEQSNLMEVFRLLDLAVLTAVHEKNQSAALHALEGIASLYRSCEFHPLLFNDGYRNKYRHAYFRDLSLVCSLPEIDGETLAPLREMLAGIDVKKSVRWSLVSERAYAQSFVFSYPYGTAGIWPLNQLERDIYLDMMAELVDITKSDWNKIDRESSDPASANKYSQFLSGGVYHYAMLITMTAAAVSEERKRLALAGLAARQFMEDNRRPPTQWSDLVPKYLPEIPTHCRDNVPFEIHPVAEGDFVISARPRPTGDPADPMKPIEFRFSILDISLEQNW